LFHGAALPLADHSQSGGHGADEHEDDAAQPGDHDDRRTQLGVEEHVDLGGGDGIAGRRAGAGGARLRQAAQSRLGGEQLGAVDEDAWRRPRRRRRHDGDDRLAAAQRLAGAAGVATGVGADHVELLRQSPGDEAGAGPQHGRGDFLDVEARRVAEHDQKEERQQEQHRQGPRVAAQLAELLDHDGAHGLSSRLRPGNIQHL